jgi:hypothetical protein
MLPAPKALPKLVAVNRPAMAALMIERRIFIYMYP